MILVQEVTILPSGTVYFSVRGKKEWQNNLSKAFAVDGNTENTSLKCECSCIICPNVQNFCPKNGQFSMVGDVITSPASPCCTLISLSLPSFLTAFVPVNLPTLTTQVLHFSCSLFYVISSRYSTIFVHFYVGFTLFIVLLYFIISQRFLFYTSMIFL